MEPVHHTVLLVKPVFNNHCSQAGGAATCFYQGVGTPSLCQPLRTYGQTCFSTSQCSQSGAPLYCNGNTGTCLTFQALGQGCNTTYPCIAGINCVTDATQMIVQTCTAPAAYNQSCGFQPLNQCATNLTCIGSLCSGNMAGMPCSGNNVQGTCNSGLICIQGNGPNYCAPQVGITGNCTLTANLCLTGLLCYNNTCIQPQTAGQPCDPTGFINPLNPLSCNSSLQCTRGFCIVPYSLSVGTLCARDSDCDTAYCDPLYSVCSRRKLCTSSAAGCSCVCNSGRENLGQCIMDNCANYRTNLYTCLTNKGYSIAQASISQIYAWLDSSSLFYQQCQQQHQQYVICEATMYKWGAPSLALGDNINYNLAAVSGANTLTQSFMLIVAVVISIVLMW